MLGRPATNVEKRHPMGYQSCGLVTAVIHDFNLSHHNVGDPNSVPFAAQQVSTSYTTETLHDPSLLFWRRAPGRLPAVEEEADDDDPETR